MNDEWKNNDWAKTHPSRHLTFRIVEICGTQLRLRRVRRLDGAGGDSSAALGTWKLLSLKTQQSIWCDEELQELKAEAGRSRMAGRRERHRRGRSNVRMEHHNVWFMVTMTLSWEDERLIMKSAWRATARRCSPFLICTLELALLFLNFTVAMY
jgi:hypothetical protein